MLRYNSKESAKTLKLIYRYNEKREWLATSKPRLADDLVRVLSDNASPGSNKRQIQEWLDCIKFSFCQFWTEKRHFLENCFFKV